MPGVFTRREGWILLDDKREHERCAISALVLVTVGLIAVGLYAYYVLTYNFRIRGKVGEGGATGEVGETGATGATGQSGVVGVNGTTGKTGPTGEQGLIGSQGIRGFNCWETNGTRADGNVSMCVGPIGNTGGVGPTGGIGPTGAQGGAGGLHAWDVLFTGNCSGANDANNDGVCNVTDARGAICDPKYNLTNCRGFVGYTGQQGAPGVTGPQGAPNTTAGPTGPTGCECWNIRCDGTLSLADIIAYNVNGDGSLDVNDCRGAKGPAGNKGAQGDPGFSGATGDTGPTGATGPAPPAASIPNYADRVTPPEVGVVIVTLNSSVRLIASPDLTVYFLQDYYYQFIGTNNSVYRLWFDMTVTVQTAKFVVTFVCPPPDPTIFYGVSSTDPGKPCYIGILNFEVNLPSVDAGNTTAWTTRLGTRDLGATTDPTHPFSWDCEVFVESNSTAPIMFREYGTKSFVQYPSKWVLGLTSAYRYSFATFVALVNGAPAVRYKCMGMGPRLY
jgi:hypothetical protein